MWVTRTTKKIIGASVSNYLLEKSRVTQLASGERNYHVFYHMLRGLSGKQLESLQLCDEGRHIKIYIFIGGQSLPITKFNYLNQSGCHLVDSIDDKVLYTEMVESFTTMQFQPYEVDAIFRVLAGVLLFGNL